MIIVLHPVAFPMNLLLSLLHTMYFLVYKTKEHVGIPIVLLNSVNKRKLLMLVCNMGEQTIPSQFCLCFQFHTNLSNIYSFKGIRLTIYLS